MNKHSENTKPDTCDNNVLANRLLKFRAWNHIVGRMSHTYTLEELLKEKIKFNNLRWLQFTGYKDKNGKEICEGDIVKYNKNNNDEIELVDWDSLTFNLMITYAANYNKKCEDWIDKKIFDGIEIIGNIFENPELLKATS